MADVRPESTPSVPDPTSMSPLAVYAAKARGENASETEPAQNPPMTPPASVSQPVATTTTSTPTQIARVQPVSSKREPSVVDSPSAAKHHKSEAKDEPSAVKGEPVADVSLQHLKIDSVAATVNPTVVAPTSETNQEVNPSPSPPPPPHVPPTSDHAKPVVESDPPPSVAAAIPQSVPEQQTVPRTNPFSQQPIQNVEQPPPPPPPRQPFPPPASAPVSNGGQQPYPPFITGPPPRNLPKTAKHRPKNARVFVGNLASEFTTPLEMIKIFYKYGELIEEPVLRRSFGFIQYSNPISALRAVAGEQARIIGGIPIDLSIADNREVKRGTHVVNNTPFPHGPKAAGASRKRRRSNSPTRRMGGVHPPQYRRMRPEPRNGIHMRILCMSTTARNYARTCEGMFRAETQNLGCDIVQIVAAELGVALGKCMSQAIPYVLVVASKDVEDGTCTIRTLERTGYEKAGRGNGVISLREAINVCLIDRGIIPPGGGRGGPAPPPYGAPAQGIQMVQAGWSQHGGGMHGNQQNLRKPGWMTGARAPAHAQQPSHLRGGPPAPGGMPGHVAHPGYAPTQQMAPQMPMAGNQQGYGQQGYGHSQGYPGSGAAQMGWTPGSQQSVSNISHSGYGAPQQDYGRGGYPQGGPMMGARNGPVQNARDEYDPTAVIPTGGRPDGTYNNWGAPQDQYHNRGGTQYPGRPGAAPMPPQTQGNPSSRPVMNNGNNGYSMPPPQASYRPDQAQAYGNQAYQQRPASYNQPPGAPQGNTYYLNNYTNDQQRPGSWGPAGTSQYEGGNQNQGYGAPVMQRRDGNYVSPQQPGGTQPGRVAGNGTAYNNTPPSQTGSNVVTPLVDIGKLSNLISTFTQQQNSGGRGNQRNDGNVPRQGGQTAPTGSTPGPAPLLTNPGAATARNQYAPHQYAQQMPQQQQQQFQQQGPPGQQPRGYYGR